MQTNDFENKMQQQLGQFTLAPNDEVWQRVEARLADDRKRKRAFFFWLFAGLVLLAGGAGLWVSSGNNKAVIPSPVHAQKFDNIKKAPDEKMEVEGATNNKDVTESSDIQKQQKELKKNDVVMQRSNNKTLKKTGFSITETLNNGLKEKAGSMDLIRNKFQSTTNEATSIQKHNKSMIDENEKNIVSVLKVEKDETTVIDGSEPLENLPVKQPISQSTLDTAKDSNNLKKAIQEQNDSIVISNPLPVHAKAASKKWRTGIALYTGVSDNIDKLRIGSSTKSAVPLANTLSINPIAGTSQKLNYTSHFAIGVGVFAEKKISPRIAFSTGLEYHAYAAKTLVGNRVDSAQRFAAAFAADNVGSYYRYGRNTTYVNRYHLLELPLNFQYSLSKKNNGSEYFLGLSPAFIIGSRALYYNRTSNVIYAEKKQFSNLQFMINTGVSFRVLHLKKVDLSLSPTIQYGFTNLTKPSVNTNEHLLFFGLKTKFYFKK